VRTQYLSVKIKKAETPLFPKEANIREWRKKSRRKYISASPAVIVPIIIFHPGLPYSLKSTLPAAPERMFHLQFNTPLFSQPPLKTLETRGIRNNDVECYFSRTLAFLSGLVRLAKASAQALHLKHLQKK